MNPYASPTAMANYLLDREGIAKVKLDRVLAYLDGCVAVCGRSKYSDQEEFWRQTKEEVEREAKSRALRAGDPGGGDAGGG